MDQTSYLAILSVVVILCLLPGYGAWLMLSKSKVLTPLVRNEIDSFLGTLNMEFRQMECHNLVQLKVEIVIHRESGTETNKRLSTILSLDEAQVSVE